MKVIQEYGFEYKFGYFIFENATSNNICVKAILHQFWNDFIKKECRLYYIDHIINIIA